MLEEACTQLVEGRGFIDKFIIVGHKRTANQLFSGCVAAIMELLVSMSLEALEAFSSLSFGMSTSEDSL